MGGDSSHARAMSQSLMLRKILNLVRLLSTGLLSPHKILLALLRQVFKRKTFSLGQQERRENTRQPARQHSLH